MMNLKIPIKKPKKYNCKEMEALTSALEKKGATLTYLENFLVDNRLVGKARAFLTGEPSVSCLVNELVVSGSFDPAMVYAVIQDYDFKIDYNKTKITQSNVV